MNKPNFEKYAKLIPFETTEHMWEHSSEYRDSILNSNWGPKFQQMRHDASQDADPKLREFSPLTIKERIPMPIGRDLVDIMPVTKPTTQYTFIKRAEPSNKSARGEQGYNTRGSRHKYLDLKLGDPIENNDQLDQQKIEDIEPSNVPSIWQGMYEEHRLDVSQACLDAIRNVGENTYTSASGKHTLVSYTDPSGNVHDSGMFVYPMAGDKPVADDIIAAWGQANTLNIYPDCMLMSYATHAALAQDDEFKSFDYFRDSANYENPGPGGAIISNVMGMNVFVTNQAIAKQTGGSDTGSRDHPIYMFEKSQFVIGAMRRDEMVVNTERKEGLGQGLSISSRYGFALKDPSRCLLLYT